MRHLPLMTTRFLIALGILCMPAPLLGQANELEMKPVHQAALRASQASRSDSIDILHTRIDLDLTQTGSSIIAAHTGLRFAPRVPGISELPLDLLSLTVDSVTSTSGHLAFTHSGETLAIDLGGTFSPLDTLEVTVHYHGTPVVDPGGWGGFYTSGNILYDLGVAFQLQPHSFGRAWFPCFDNFVERSTFEFIVHTHLNRHAWCNGHLVAEQDLGGGQYEGHWRIDQSIPSYLASVTASTYAAARDTFPSITGAQIPVDLVAQPTDTTAMKNSFAHLQDAFDTFEAWFGAYRWDRVGYCLTPQGAMEHPTNISYPSFIANGNLQYEATMAHELGHHWFGDLVTCARAEEMYINEGFAEYLSYLFLEDVYGHDQYIRTVRDNHRKQVHRAHLIDQGWWALADMPQDFTYGEQTYNKGADVVHTLRSYLGDSLFRAGLTSVLDTYAFQPVTSEQLRDHLSATTGVDLTNFFDDWIFQPGWASFEVDSFAVQPPVGGVFPTTVFVEQKLRGPASYYHEVPLTFTCVDVNGDRWQAPTPLMVGGQASVASMSPPFSPVHVLLNTDDRISLAITADEDTIAATGPFNYSSANLQVIATAVPAPIRLRMEQYWVAADTLADDPFAYVISPDRWWRVTGSIPPGSTVSANFTFNGTASSSGSLDVGLMQDFGGVAFREDSLVLLYRPDAHAPWSPFPSYTVNTQGSATNKIGRMEWSDLVPGDYTLGWRKSSMGVQQGDVPRGSWLIHPNPAGREVMVRHLGTGLPPGTQLQVMDTAGREVATALFMGTAAAIPTVSWRSGAYNLFARPPGETPRWIGTVVVE